MHREQNLARRRKLTILRTPFPLTKNEARVFMRSGELPDDLKERVKNYLEFDFCTNCGGVKDMSVVLRAWDDDESPCPFCVGEKPMEYEMYP